MPFPAHTRPIHAARWAAFRALLEQKGIGVSAAAEVLDKAQPQVSQFGGSNPTKIIGDDLAAQIEESFRLPPGWLDNHSSGEGTVNERQGGLPTESQFWQPDAAILTEVEKWVRFEEGAGKKYQPVRRLGRAIALLQLLMADGGRLSQEHAVALIDAARKKGADDGSGGSEEDH